MKWLELIPGLAMCSIGAGAQAVRPDDFVDVRTMIPDIALDIRYATAHNFIGRPIRGYRAAECLLTEPATAALALVQSELKASGLSLKVYDCYRPQTAVDDFVEWARDLDDEAMKAEFYPSVEKRYLFRDGYIARKSGHSRGSTVDLTIVPLGSAAGAAWDSRAELQSCENERSERFADASLDMGTGYDCFSTLSHTLSPGVSPQQRANRLLLEHLMESHGFVSLAEEWWHYTLSGEPYPDTYFDFPVD